MESWIEKLVDIHIEQYKKHPPDFDVPFEKWRKTFLTDLYNKFEKLEAYRGIYLDIEPKVQREIDTHLKGKESGSEFSEMRLVVQVGKGLEKEINLEFYEIYLSRLKSKNFKDNSLNTTLKQHLLFAYYLNKHNVIRWKELPDTTAKIRLLYFLSKTHPPKNLNSSTPYKVLSNMLNCGIEEAYQRPDVELVKDLEKIKKIL